MADYRNLINFIKSKEGGISSDPKDTASSLPSPCGLRNGFPIHTNKGVTWKTFKGLASKLGYNPSCDNFIKMPDSIWGLIYKDGYWNPMKCDDIRNQAIANTFVEMAWGSGTVGATNLLKQFFKKEFGKTFNNIGQMVSFVNDLDRKGKTPELFEKLYDFRANKYATFKSAKTHLRGWLNRLDAFYLMNKPYALSTGNKLSLILGIGLIALGGAYIYVRTRK
jgi:lysozyme family protein